MSADVAQLQLCLDHNWLAKFEAQFPNRKPPLLLRILRLSVEINAFLRQLSPLPQHAGQTCP